jgi:cytoplasmic FMR1 interacting protein
VVLLNQQKRFEALDFCSHIVKVYDVDPRDETVGGVVSFLEIFSHSSGFY